MDTAAIEVRPDPSQSSRVDCPNCAFSEWTSSARFTPDSARYFNEQIVHGSAVRRHDYVHHSGTSLAFFAVVNSGFLKSTLIGRNGNVQITGFSMRGDVVGLDAVGGGIHQCDTIALQDASLCGIAYPRFQQLVSDIPAIQYLLNKKMGTEIARSHRAMASLSAMYADERLVNFLLEFSERFAAIGCSKLRFRLPMQRQEIGEYLGLQLATVSRGLSRLQEADAIAIDGKDITIKNVHKMWCAVETLPLRKARC